MRAAAALFLLIPSLVFAQAKELPDMPQPKAEVMALVAASPSIKATPKPAGTVVVDREFKIDTTAMFAMWAADTASTAHVFSEYPWAHETGLIGTGTRKTATVMTAWLAVDVGAVFVSYEWKKHVRNKYLHPLWRVPLLWRTGEHALATVNNATYSCKTVTFDGIVIPNGCTAWPNVRY